MAQSWITARCLIVLLGSIGSARVAARCPEPFYPENAYTNTDSADHITYSCNEGYRLKGQTENFCMGDYWAFPPPVCEILYCPPLEPLQYGEFFPETSTKHGTTVRYRCHSLTKLVGASEIRCVGEQWIPEPPSCVVEECELDLAGKNLRVDYGTMEVGDILLLECSAPGLTMVGESLISCLQNKHWDPEPPYCVGRGVKPPQCSGVHDTSDTSAVVARDGFCYSFLNSKKTFYEAKSTCEKNNGHLVHIPDEATNTWLVATLTALPEWNNAATWIGLKWTRLTWNSGKWQWLGNGGRKTPLRFDNKQSSSNQGQCQYMSVSEDSRGLWWKDYCAYRSHKHKVVCQYPIDA